MKRWVDENGVEHVEFTDAESLAHLKTTPITAPRRKEALAEIASKEWTEAEAEHFLRTGERPLHYDPHS